MRRGLRVLLAFMLGFSVITVAWVGLRGVLGLPRGGWWRYMPLALALLPIVVVLPWWIWRTSWIRRGLLSSGGRICTHCGYDVSSLAPSGVCPECGGPYDIRRDRRLWENVGAEYGGPEWEDEPKS